MIEPRVMRVLVALGEMPGKVLSRDDLIELCWDGQIVSDKAITRATSLLRHTLEDMTGGAVRLETIPRVGFRLLVDGQQAGGISSGKPHPGVAAQLISTAKDPDAVGGPRRWSRRAAATGLVMAGGGAAAMGYAGWLWTQRNAPDPRAAELYRRGQAIQKAGVAESMGEAIEAYKQAVAIDPRYADAWGALALSYRYPTNSEVMRLSDPREVRVAAGRALALDPDNAEARLALILAYPSFSLLEQEERLRAFLTDHPDSALGNAVFGWLLFGVGRIEEGLTASRRAIEIDPMRQIGWIVQVQTLCYSGRNHEADLAADEARSRWPRDFRIWFLGYMVLADSRRHAEAITYLRATNRLPGAIPLDTMATLVSNAEAFSTGRGIAEYRNRNRNAPAATLIASIFVTVSSMVVSGMTDELFALFEAFFFGGMVNGTRVAPPGSLDMRPTNLLFAPTVLSLRHDPRHGSLLERTGLEDYWRKSGTQPDFRRGKSG